MPKKETSVFSPGVPPDLDHGSLIREEALEWLEIHHPGVQSFSTPDVLRMSGETGRRWLIARLRGHSIGDEAEFSLPDTADALAVLYLRSKGVKFRDAVDAVLGRTDLPRSGEPRYGGVWNRLIVSTLERLRRRVPPRLVGAAISALIPESGDRVNCLVIVRRRGKTVRSQVSEKPAAATHDYVYRLVLERPAPTCMVFSPSLEILFMSKDQLPARSEITSRHFHDMYVQTELDGYELLLGTMNPVSLRADEETLRFVGRVLDIVFADFNAFLAEEPWSGLQTPVQPDPRSADDLQLWLITQFITRVYPGSLCEVSEISPGTRSTKVLASSAARPWEPSPWEPAKSLEMLSGYASVSGIPLIVDRVERPWTELVEGVESELRYVRTVASKGRVPSAYSAMALPIILNSGHVMGSLYVLMPRPGPSRLKMEVRILSLFGRIVGETVERQRAAAHSARYASNVVTSLILKKEQFKAALLELLVRKTSELKDGTASGHDLRLPFLLLATHAPEPDQIDSNLASQLRSWLVKTMDHIEWKSFVQSHWSAGIGDLGRDGFIGEVPNVGMMIALGDLVTKDQLDRIRSAFPAAINQTTPTNSPVKFVAWVLDMPAQRIIDAAQKDLLPSLADEIEGWAFDVTTLVDDLAQITDLARGQGQWDVALRRIRQALQKPGARTNPYLPRIAADCSLSLGDWPSALRYAQEAVALSQDALGSGHVRSMCLEGDARICLCDPIGAWDRYSQAAQISPHHPLPRYYRGQGMLLVARLLRVYEDEARRSPSRGGPGLDRIAQALSMLTTRAMEDLTSAADLLDRWGLIPEAYQYRNFHLVPTLVGQGTSYLLMGLPGPAASRLQSARRSFPKDDFFFREFLFAKCWEQGVHRQYADLVANTGWSEMAARLKPGIKEATTAASKVRKGKSSPS
jgi:hypothetical protein